MSENLERILGKPTARPRAVPLQQRSPPGGKILREDDAEMPVSVPLPHTRPVERIATNLDSNAVSPEPSTGRKQLEAAGIYKSYRKGSVIVPVLQDLSISVREGEFLAVVGQSGSGKSTLLHLLGTLDGPDQGQIRFEGRRIDNLPRREKDLLRNRRFGMIFQFYHLLPELTTLQNVLAPLMIAESVWSYFCRRLRHRQEARRLLAMVGLTHRLKHKPRELSGGEMQRAAIARALVARPTLLLADEPTGNLDQSTGQEILHLLRTLNRREKLTIVMVTHDTALARQADRIVRLTGGRIAA